MRSVQTFPIQDLFFWKKQLLHWAGRHELALYLDSNGRSSNSDGVTRSHPVNASGWECLVAAGAVSVLDASAGSAFEQFRSIQDDKNDWLFGFFGYDLKNELERLASNNFDGVGLPDMGFFQPEVVAGIRDNQIEIQAIERKAEEVFEEIKNLKCKTRCLQHDKRQNVKVELKPRMSKEEYLGKVEDIRQHIAEGDLYEMNLCQEFFSENADFDPVAVFERLNEIGKAPF